MATWEQGLKHMADGGAITRKGLQPEGAVYYEGDRDFFIHRTADDFSEPYVPTDADIAAEWELI